MKFGRYRGWLLSDVPIDYRRWLRRQPGLTPELREGIALSLGMKVQQVDVHRHRPAPIDWKGRAAGERD